LFPADERWKRKKRRMIRSNRASLMLDRAGSKRAPERDL
jgi:hypothetical protein